jgi:lactoylglutathione lyase
MGQSMLTNDRELRGDLAMGNLFMGLDHINIQTRDLEKSVQFYSEALGFTLVKRLDLGSMKLVFLTLDTVTVELSEANEGVPCRDGVIDHFSLRVPDIFAAVEVLKNYGLELITPEPVALESLFHYIFFFRGPSGEKIELVQL